MLKYAFSTASAYFHLPIDEQEDADIANYERKYITWTAEPSGLSTRPRQTSRDTVRRYSGMADNSHDVVNEILQANDDLYRILGVDRTAQLDQMTLRRAYLRRSRACHPDKFLDHPDATQAFQKVAIAYDVLSKPSSRKAYDSRSPTSDFDVFAMRPTGHAEETFRGVILSVFNDFLDGDLEVIHTLLKTINDINPSIKLGEDGINSVLMTIQSIRERALTCRTCIYTLHAELSRLLEVQHALRQLSYFNIMGRSRLAIQLTRITLSLPIALEKAVQGQYQADLTRTRNDNSTEEPFSHQDSNETPGVDASSTPVPTIFPRHVTLLIRGLDGALERMENILK